MYYSTPVNNRQGEPQHDRSINPGSGPARHGGACRGAVPAPASAADSRLPERRGTGRPRRPGLGRRHRGHAAPGGIRHRLPAVFPGAGILDSESAGAAPRGVRRRPAAGVAHRAAGGGADVAAGFHSGGGADRRRRLRALFHRHRDPRSDHARRGEHRLRPRHHRGAAVSGSGGGDHAGAAAGARQPGKRPSRHRRGGHPGQGAGAVHRHLCDR